MMIDSVEVTSHIERAVRLRKLRELTNLTSDEFADMIGFSRQTVSSWENAKDHGLSANGADTIVRTLIKAGVHCDFMWLWFGAGEAPYLLTEKINERQIKAAMKKFVCPDDPRGEEIRIFERYYPEGVIVEIKHNAMQPFYKKGDWVAGCWVATSCRLLNKMCIMEDEDCFEVRLVQNFNENGYNLRFTSYPSENQKPFELINQNPMRLAPIIRVWRNW
jgi:hypothetical protein